MPFADLGHACAILMKKAGSRRLLRSPAPGIADAPEVLAESPILTGMDLRKLSFFTDDTVPEYCQHLSEGGQLINKT